MHMDEFRPNFLIAMPQLADPNFARRIVLILHHNTDGAVGLVMNDPTALDLGAFARNNNFPCHPNLSSVPVYRGGPVEPQVGWLLHSDETVKERQEILPGLHISGSQDSLCKLLESGSRPIKLLLGYAGWEGGQLESEMAQGAWLSTAPGVKHILHTDPAQMWNLVLQEMGIDPANLAIGGGIH